MSWHPCCCPTGELTSCCADLYINSTIHATFVRTAGTCTVFDFGTVDLTFVPADTAWEYVPAAFSLIFFKCLEGPAGTFRWLLQLQGIACPGGGGAMPSFAFTIGPPPTCADPLNLTFTGTYTPAAGQCCFGLGPTTWQVTVTE